MFLACKANTVCYVLVYTISMYASLAPDKLRATLLDADGGHAAVDGRQDDALDVPCLTLMVATLL